MRVLAKRDRRRWIALAPALERRRQHAERDRGHRRDLELARLSPRALRALRRARSACVTAARASGRNALPAAVSRTPFGQTLEQRAAELPLERLDLLRQRRLGDQQLLGGARERAFVGDRQQVSQLAKVHRDDRDTNRNCLSTSKIDVFDIIGCHRRPCCHEPRPRSITSASTPHDLDESSRVLRAVLRHGAHRPADVRIPGGVAASRSPAAAPVRSRRRAGARVPPRGAERRRLRAPSTGAPASSDCATTARSSRGCTNSPTGPCRCICATRPTT